MTAENEIAVGCGRWDNAWTMHFGHGMRLRLKNQTDRAQELALATADRADYLKAQPDDTKLPPVHSRIETDITLIDPDRHELDMGTPFDDLTEKSHPRLEEGFLLHGDLGADQRH